MRLVKIYLNNGEEPINSKLDGLQNIKTINQQIKEQDFVQIGNEIIRKDMINRISIFDNESEVIIKLSTPSNKTDIEELIKEINNQLKFQYPY